LSAQGYSGSACCSSITTWPIWWVVQHDAGRFSRQRRSRRAAGAPHLGHHRVLAAGEHLHRIAGAHAAMGDAAPEHPRLVARALGLPPGHGSMPFRVERDIKPDVWSARLTGAWRARTEMWAGE
jgi:hypothetical protein